MKKGIKLYVLLLLLLTWQGLIKAQSYDQLIDKADLYYQEKQYEKAAPLYEQASQINKVDETSAYNAACSYALSNNKPKALECLNKAVENGFDDFKLIPADKDLYFLHSSELEWDTILANLYEKASIYAKGNKGFYLYKAACLWATAQKKEHAIKDIKSSVQCGGMKLEWLENQPKLNNLHNNPEWKTISSDLKQNIEKEKSNFYWGIYFGVLCFICIYNLFMFFSIREVSFLYYALFVFAYLQFEGTRTAALGFYLTDLFVWIDYLKPKSPLSMFITMPAVIFLLLFTSSFLNLKQISPRINKLLKCILVGLVVITVASYYVDLLYKVITFVLVLIIYLFSLIIGIYCFSKGYRPARFFVVGMTVMAFTVFWVILASFNMVDEASGISVFHIDNIGTLFFSVILSFAIGDKVNILKTEKEGAQEKALEVLEERVQERTIEVVKQKNLVEEKHKEITDSINYAERIQRTFLATGELLSQHLKNYFVFFKPKDVVSGDFYWAETLPNGTFILATADSTGHGVPGAIMSLLNITSLEKAVEHLTDPADILNHTRQTIINRLKRDGSIEGGKDGMDCSLIIFDFKNKELHIAAANNPVWIIRSNELIEIKPDKIPVGKHDKDKESFTAHKIAMKDGDIIYTLTDGFPDQFGGDKGKKFMSKNLKELLVANASLPMNEQKALLDKTFKNWIGELEQVDDVTLIGIKI